MSEPEKLYTLPEVLEIVKEHAGALFGAGAALEATEGEDPEMLAMVGERAERAQKQFWEFESENVLDEAAHAAWHQRDENDEVSPPVAHPVRPTTPADGRRGYCCKSRRSNPRLRRPVFLAPLPHRTDRWGSHGLGRRAQEGLRASDRHRGN